MPDFFFNMRYRCDVVADFADHPHRWRRYHTIPPPRPQDWDAFLRMCFSGKNKMLRSIFGNKNAPVTIDAGAAAAAADGATATAGAPTLLTTAGASAAASASPVVDASTAAAVSAASATDGTVANAADGAPSPRSRLVALLVEAGVAEMRPNGLSLPDFLRTYRLLRSAGARFKVAGQAVAAANAAE
jgi:hypothetical protein